ncbi:MAG: hypothetical protein V1911_02395 [Candidatus Micrarchaeota archaeon]
MYRKSGLVKRMERKAGQAERREIGAFGMKGIPLTMMGVENKLNSIEIARKYNNTLLTLVEKLERNRVVTKEEIERFKKEKNKHYKRFLGAMGIGGVTSGVFGALLGSPTLEGVLAVGTGGTTMGAGGSAIAFSNELRKGQQMGSAIKTFRGLIKKDGTLNKEKLNRIGGEIWASNSELDAYEKELYKRQREIYVRRDNGIKARTEDRIMKWSEKQDKKKEAKLNKKRDPIFYRLPPEKSS